MMFLVGLLFRFLAAAVIVCLPIVYWLQTNDNPTSLDGMVWVLPFYAAVPLFLVTLFVFVPLEYALNAEKTWYWKNLAIPLAGGLFPEFFNYFMTREFGLIAVFSDPNSSIVFFWAGVGVAWGVIWRATAFFR